MGYADQKYYTRDLTLVSANVTSTSTGTASAQVVTNTNVATATNAPPYFTRKTVINNVEAVVITAPNAGAATTKIAVLNGTNTCAVVTIGTLTAGQDGTAVMTVANATFTAGAQPTYNILSTTTASQTVTQGNYNIFFETQEVFVSP